MAGTSTKTKVVTIRVPVVLAARWAQEAVERGVTLAALVFDYAQRGDPIRPQVATSLSRPERHHLNEVTRPSMIRIGSKPIAPADPTSEKAVAKVLPVAGTQFDRQPTWWEKKQQQAPTKGKGKR